MLTETANAASTSLDFVISGRTAPSTFGAGAARDQSGLIFSLQAHSLSRAHVYTYVAVSGTRQVIKGPTRDMSEPPPRAPQLLEGVLPYRSRIDRSRSQGARVFILEEPRGCRRAPD